MATEVHQRQVSAEPHSVPSSPTTLLNQRNGRNSNPRALWASRFQGGCNCPLCHRSDDDATPPQDVWPPGERAKLNRRQHLGALCGATSRAVRGWLPPSSCGMRSATGLCPVADSGRIRTARKGRRAPREPDRSRGSRSRSPGRRSRRGARRRPTVCHSPARVDDVGGVAIAGHCRAR